MSKPRDQIYRQARSQIESFRFDSHVSQVFEDMIQRSVPGYQLILSLVGVVSARYAQDNSACYDLGCSLGASTLAMRHHINTHNCQLIAIDNSKAMYEQCTVNIANDNGQIPVHLYHDDILNISFQPSSIIILNFTLQFIPIEKRHELLKKICNSLLPGGVLLLSEKIHFPDKDEEHEMQQLHHTFKSLNGYSQLEIAQKREALENILVPETVNTHKQRLYDVGFSEVYNCIQCFNFISLLAIK